jgi:H+/Cl- antiporter ClcA
MKLIHRLRLKLKGLFDRIGNESLKLNLLQAIPFWIASIITGLIAVLYARIFLLAEQSASHIFRQYAWSLFLITPTCFVIAWWVVKRFAPYSRGSGIPQVMASIELANPKDNSKVVQLLSLRIILVKVLSSVFLALGGGVIGREGPTIQIAGSVFRKINQWLPDWWPKVSKKNMIMAGAAAGLAAAFNTPLGGIVFAVEELTRTHIRYFKTALFSAVIIAGLTAQGLLGPYLYLGYPEVGHLTTSIFTGVIFVAIVAGLAGSSTAKIILWIFKWKRSFTKKYQNLLYVVVCGLIIASLAFFIDKSVLGSGKELMTNTLFTTNKYLSWYSPLLRITGSILSFTTGAAGGVFAPALSAGASLGAVISGWFHLTNANTNLLILSGMVAFLTGITRTPFTSAIIVLEMTDRHSLIFYLMLAGMLSSIVSVVVDRHSFYDHMKFHYLREVMDEPSKSAQPSLQKISDLSGSNAPSNQ